MASVTQTAQKRKRTAKACPNPLFEKWLEEWKKEAQKRGLNSVHTYRKALSSLREYPLPLKNGQEAKQLPNVGDKIARMLDRKIQEHNDASEADSQDEIQHIADTDRVIPSVKKTTQPCDVPPVTIRQEPSSPAKKRHKINREYVPLHRSGGYAVLVALLKAKQSSAGYAGYMVKKDLLKAAQPFCDASFTIPEPGSHYTAWSSVSTLIKKQLVAKSGTVPAKYMLTDAGLELAQKLVRVENCTNGYSPESNSDNGDVSKVMSQNSKQKSVLSGVTQRKNREELEEDFESSLPKPWLLCQGNGQLTKSSKISSISLKEKPNLEKEVIVSDKQPPLNSEGTKSPVTYTKIPSSLPSSSVLPSNSVIHNSVQSDEPSVHFWYVDTEDNLVHEKNKAAILFDSCTFSTAFLVKATRKTLHSTGWLYTIDHSRPCGATDDSYVFAYVNDLDAPELNTLPSNRVPLPSNHATTSLSLSPTNNDHSIVMLSSDSEDDLPSLSQRIGLSKTVGSSKEPINVMACEATNSEVPSVSSMTVQATSHRHLNPNSALGIAIMVTAHDDDVSMATEPKNDHTTKTSNCDIITITGNSPMTTKDQQPQEVNRDSSSCVQDHSSCSWLTLQPGEYEMILYIDNVEAHNKSNVNAILMTELTKKGINCKVCKLQVGDFLWVAKKLSATGPPLELVLDHIIERKRMDDLSRSIIDRRFAEQKFRLTNCGINHVIYLIEEYGDPGRFSIPTISLNQAITNTQIIDGFYIRRTQNIKDTVAYLHSMTKCLQKHYSGVVLEEHSVECVTSGEKRLLPPAVVSSGVVRLMSFTAFSAASVKSKVMTVTEMFAKHLIQIPGFSADKAEAVIAQFPTPASLFKAYSQCSPPEKRPLLLENIKHGRRNRNLGKSLSMLVHDLYWSGQLSSL